MEIIFNETGKIRFDKWLAYKFPEKSREFFNNNIKSGNITLNDVKTKSSVKLKIGDKIIIDDEILNDQAVKIMPNKKIKIKIVFENDDFLIVDKPAGLLVHPVTLKDEDTLANALVNKYPEIVNVGEDPLRPGIVHRLDKDTSGLIIVAKNQKSFKILKDKFQKRQIHKAYYALVYGKLKNKIGEIDAPITRSKSKFNRRKISFDKEMGKEALTRYEVEKEYDDVSLLRAYPETGRTHQIRVHLASMSNFVIGDNEYGSKKINSKYNIARQFLHAFQIDFTYKKTKYHFESKLPADLAKVLKEIE